MTTSQDQLSPVQQSRGPVSDILNSPESERQIIQPTLWALGVTSHWLFQPNLIAPYPNGLMSPIFPYQGTVGSIMPYPNQTAHNPATPRLSEVENYMTAQLSRIQNYLLGSP